MVQAKHVLALAAEIVVVLALIMTAGGLYLTILMKAEPTLGPDNQKTSDVSITNSYPEFASSFLEKHQGNLSSRQAVDTLREQYKIKIRSRIRIWNKKKTCCFGA